ncbi:MAG TPA: DUF3943 domain-containing protein [Gemmatimonadales bacterium]|jgi:hypothetical protein
MLLLLVIPAAPLPMIAQSVTTSTDSTPPPPRRPKPLLAVGEVTGINIVVQRMNWWLRHADWADISLKTWSDNIRLGWEWDVDQFRTNMFGHPWGGGFFFNAGRDNGIGFWGSTPLTFLGSAEWEYFGENERPSLNDLYNTAFGGIIFGEVGHRLSNIVRDNRARGFPRAMRELASIPLDPVGGLNRMIRGEAFRHADDGPLRDHTPLAVDLQGGVRLAVDSGPQHRSSWSGTMLIDIAYGSPFDKPFHEPFDVFHLRFQFSPAQGGINTTRILGRLYGRELTDSAARLRNIFTVAQKFEYLAGPAYHFGGQSVETGFVSNWAATPHAHIQSELYGEWLLLGGIESPGAGVRERDYDFGPGAGLNASASLLVSGATVLSARWRFAYLHSVSGSPADYRISHASIEGLLPIGHALGIGAYAGWYRQLSDYGPGKGLTYSYPELRFYLAWRRGQWRHPLQNPAGNGP